MTAIEVFCVLAGVVFGWVSAVAGLLLVTRPTPRYHFTLAASMMARRGRPEREAIEEAGRVIRSTYQAIGRSVTKPLA